MRYLPYGLIIAALLIAGGIYIDRTAKTSLLARRQSASNTTENSATDGATGQITANRTSMPMPKIDFTDLGPAPEFTGISKWLNSDPLTMQGLRGKVVLIDFWTYSCINCIRTLPYVTKWYDSYKDQGFVVVGVHTPEFAFEKDTENVARAIKRFKINYPVAQDNDYATWNAYNNIYWPAEYLINKNGRLVYTHFGEGKYDVTENAIRALLELKDDAAAGQGQAADSGRDQTAGQAGGQVKSPEMYFGILRLQNFGNEGAIPDRKIANYTLPLNLLPDTFALEGKWQFDDEKARLMQGPGKIKLRFNAGKVHMVAKSDKPTTVHITVDGQLQPDAAISASQLYTLFDSTDYANHIIEIEIPEGGFEAFTFTFG